MIATKKAARMTLDELRRLVDFCNCQRESLWDDLDLQGLLDVYHASAVWDGVETWLNCANEGGTDEEQKAALRAWRAIHRASARRNRLRADGAL